MPSDDEVLIRLKGTPNSVERTAKTLRKTLHITEESDDKHNDRHDPKIVSRYLTAETPDNTPSADDLH